jgi:alkylated DNA repair protein (DNA oxidative demethylase)
MGSHRDADENEPRAPVLSVSLGDDAVFHVGGVKRSDPKIRVVLRSGDVCLLGGLSRFAYHGIDRILPGTSSLIPGGGRINLTLRRVTPFD